MAMDLDALKRDLNVVVGSREDAEFYYFPAQDAVTYLQWAFCTAKPVAECCDREKLVRMVIPMLVEFCGTSREGASEADISELFDKAKAAAIAALRSLDGDGVNGAVSDDAGGDPFRRSVMRKFTRQE